MVQLEKGNVKCPRCNGRGELRVRFSYKDHIFYYFKKCGYCYTKGYLDWIEIARGRKPGIKGMFLDIHPAGSCRITSKDLGGDAVYDGHNYISTDTLRGEALWYELITKRNSK